AVPAKVHANPQARAVYDTLNLIQKQISEKEMDKTPGAQHELVELRDRATAAEAALGKVLLKTEGGKKDPSHS
ncbi:MAG: hypothetical protein Q9174_006159, partial [Haloplaca sp. 1 TL-2023]